MSEASASFAQFIPFILLSIPWAIVHYFLARRLGKSPALWVVLTLIPVFGFFFSWYALYRTIFTILDRLDGKKSSV